MKTKISTLTLALLFTILCAVPAFADTPEKMIIKLQTNEFEIAETDHQTRCLLATLAEWPAEPAES